MKYTLNRSRARYDMGILYLAADILTAADISDPFVFYRDSGEPVLCRYRLDEKRRVWFYFGDKRCGCFGERWPERSRYITGLSDAEAERLFFSEATVPPVKRWARNSATHKRT